MKMGDVSVTPTTSPSDLVTRKSVMDAVCYAVSDYWFDADKRGALSVLLIDTIEAVPAFSIGPTREKRIARPQPQPGHFDPDAVVARPYDRMPNVMARLAELDGPVNAWHPIADAPKGADGKPLYLQIFVPEMAQPGDRMAGVCIGWWDDGEWWSEGSDWPVSPTLFCEIPELPGDVL